MNLPEIGDIWKWHHKENIWTVMVLKHIQYTEWECLCLEDGDMSSWDFGPSKMPYWSKLV